MPKLLSLNLVKVLFLIFEQNFGLIVGQHLSTIQPGRWTQIQRNHHRSTSTSRMRYIQEPSSCEMLCSGEMAYVLPSSSASCPLTPSWSLFQGNPTRATSYLLRHVRASPKRDMTVWSCLISLPRLVCSALLSSATPCGTIQNETMSTNTTPTAD
ncbi:hypothetical protein BDP81DRAFT_84878 [Colletotrichum phormii]|uniref:Secreted protein n=1 Tax=Colletotrichum phormii TaxID=359342 RepID=A0AAJ0A235_9PEZI|nr:uncharacterized protein BDP81DRAFT_84878 [Colletotrichum phormii]KAK1654533.1 hypothetical protein BDP81DRAFT_84878 [Colletotrichum phormii]